MAVRFFTEKKAGGSISIIIGILSLIEAKKLYAYSHNLFTGDHALPGFIGILLVLFGFGLIIEKGGNQKEVQFPEGKTRLSLISTILILFAYCFLIASAGYIISTLAASIVLVKLIGSYRWFFSIFVGGIITAVLYVLFIVLLKTPVPIGIFAI